MRYSALLAACLALGGCAFPRRQATAPPPPGPVPVRVPDQISTTQTPPPANLPAPPALPARAEGEPAENTAALIPEVPDIGPPAEPRPKPVRRPPAPVETHTEAASSAPADPPYRLGELRSASEREGLRKQTESLLGACAAALVATEGRRLTAQQTELANRVRLFALQARVAMESDPVEAKNLAAKGRTFAEALLAELR